MPTSKPRVVALIAVAMLLAGFLSPRATHAQSGQQCFNVPGITNCIQGRFLSYWRENGGLAVFGYPLSGEFAADTPNGRFTVQIFERNLLEFHPENQAPYDVLLGRLGDERLQQLGRDWNAEPKGTQQGNCLWAAETQHSVCGEFKNYFQNHGLNDPKLDRNGRSVQLFGLPLTEPRMETNANGDNVLTQWFERARMELHPGKGILLGLLGKEVGLTPPTGGPPPAADPCAGIPGPVDATISPNCVKYGASFRVNVFGFDPDQEIGYWITDEKGVTVGTNQTVFVGSDGSGYIDISTTDYFGYTLNPGNYVFVAQDAAGIYRPSTAPFRVIP